VTNTDVSDKGKKYISKLFIFVTDGGTKKARVFDLGKFILLSLINVGKASAGLILLV